MKVYVEIGSTPAEEKCIMVNKVGDYVDMMRAECRVWKRQLERTFPDVLFVVKREEHEFGYYYEVAAAYDDRNNAEADAAYDVEDKAPLWWDEQARAELDTIEGYWGKVQ